MEIDVIKQLGNEPFNRFGENSPDDVDKCGICGRRWDAHDLNDWTLVPATHTFLWEPENRLASYDA